MLQSINTTRILQLLRFERRGCGGNEKFYQRFHGEAIQEVIENFSGGQSKS